MSEVIQKELPGEKVSLRETVEFGLVWLSVRVLRLFPRRLARAIGAAIGALAYYTLGRLRRVGLRNLELAFPKLSETEREAILRRDYRNLGWLLAEFCQMPGYTPDSASRFIRY